MAFLGESGNDLVREFKASHQLLMISVTEVAEKCENNVVEVQELLQGFLDLLPEDLHVGLPPLRSIQDQVDLVSSSILPNYFIIG